MKKSIIVMATLAALSGFAQATTTTLGAVEWIPGATDSTSWEGSTTDKLVFNGTFKNQTAKPGSSSEWTNVELFIQGTADKTQVSTITGGTLEFVAKHEAVTPPDFEGQSYNHAVLGGNSTLTIDVGTLLLGEQTVDSELNGANRGIRLSGSGNTLNIFADRIVSYTGDEFVHVRKGDGSSVANIGTADRRIGYFEAHTGWGKDDWGVAILQVNEGNTLNFFADEAHFDGSTFISGGVFGSGSHGTLNVDANKLFIDGNICGTYGLIPDDNHLFKLSVSTQQLDLKGDINAGSLKDPDQYSNNGRTAVINLSADTGAMIGDIRAYERGNIGVYSANGLAITGDIDVANNGQVVLGGVMGDDATIASVGGSINFNGNITVSDEAKMTFGGDVIVSEGDIKVEGKGLITVDGRLNAKSSDLAFVDSLSRNINSPALFTATNSDVGGLVLKNGASATFSSVSTSAKTVLENNSTIAVENASSFGDINFSNGGTATLSFNGGESSTGVVSGTGNMMVGVGTTVSVASKAEGSEIVAVASPELIQKAGSAKDGATLAGTALTTKQIGTGGVEKVTLVADKIAAGETEEFGSYSATIDENGSVIAGSEEYKLNSKTAQVGETIGFNLLSWRLEMNDMNKRLGELRDSEGDTGVWARVNAGKQKYAGSKNNFQQLQFGADTKVDALAGAYVGGAFSYTNSDISYVGGNGDNNIYGLSAYASWLGDTGSFMDVIAKVARLESDSKVFGTSADFDTYAYSISAEVGHRFDIGTVAFVEPQLEVNYGYVDGKGFDTVSSTGVRVGTDVDAVESLVGRVGFRAGFTCPQKKGNAYIHASVLREFDGDMKVSRGDGAYTQDMGDTWFEYGIGGNWNVSPSTQVYADVQRTSGADLSEPWRVNVGARYVF